MTKHIKWLWSPLPCDRTLKLRAIHERIQTVVAIIMGIAMYALEIRAVIERIW